jgi:uncharacterized protein (TIGR02231 family)
MRKGFLFALAALAQFCGAASAQNIETKSVVASVVVHPDAATVTREASVDLPVGGSTVVFTGVPYPLIVESLRASGEAQGMLTIGGVEARAAPANVKAPEDAVAARLKELRAARAAVEVTVEALKAKLAMIVNYSRAEPAGEGDQKYRIAVADWSAAFDAIGAAHAKTGEELRVATARAREIDVEIANLMGAGGGGQKTGLTRDVALFVQAASSGRAKLVLTYQTGAASWRTAYDARLDTAAKDGKPSLEFLRRAVITQQTGEDWTNVALAVSTVGARRAASAPNVTPQLVSFVAPPVMARAKAVAPAPGAVGPADEARNAPAAPAAAMQRAQEAVADLAASTYAAVFNIAGLVSVPGDGSAKSLVLSSRVIEPKLTIRTTPALDPSAYLEARLTNEDEAPLTPGVATVQRDGLYVGQTRLPLVAPGDDADFGFGADDRVNVARVPVKRRENEPGWFGQTKTDAREYKTSVKNLHDFPVHVTVIDQIPFSENSAITVETLPQTTPPTQKQVDDKRGVMSWSFELGAGEAKDIHLAYRLKWPADREIEVSAAP